MTSFSYNEHHSFLLDSSPMFLIPDTTTNMSCFSEQYSILNICKPCFSPQQHHPLFYDQADPTVNVLPSVNISTDSTTRTTKISTCSNNSSSFAASGQYHQVTNHTVKRKKNFQQPHSKLKGKKLRKETTTSSNIDGGCITSKSEEKMKNKRSRRSGDNDKKKKKKNSGDQETERNGDLSGYVHVKARRGQATDSHSLAERVRRERISERMKLLQALVPGCDKVTGKALMLDYIINYVQSLQTQIEFLTLKIASVDPMFYDYVMNLNAVQNQTNQGNVQQQNHTQATYNIVNASGGSSPNQQNHAQATDNIFITSGGYSLIHTSTLLQQAHMSNNPNIMSQSQSQSSNNRQLLWDADEQRQSMINHSGFINNLSSLHMH